MAVNVRLACSQYETGGVKDRVPELQGLSQRRNVHASHEYSRVNNPEKR